MANERVINTLENIAKLPLIGRFAENMLDNIYNTEITKEIESDYQKKETERAIVDKERTLVKNTSNDNELDTEEPLSDKAKKNTKDFWLEVLNGDRNNVFENRDDELLRLYQESIMDVPYSQTPLEPPRHELGEQYYQEQLFYGKSVASDAAAESPAREQPVAGQSDLWAFLTPKNTATTKTQDVEIER